MNPLTVYSADLPERDATGAYVPFADTFSLLQAEVAALDSGAEVIGIQEKLLSVHPTFGVIRSQRVEIRWTGGAAQQGKAITAVTNVRNMQNLLECRLQAYTGLETAI